MKKASKTFIFIFISSLSYAQPNDSLVYKTYHSFKNVTEVKYAYNYYSNGQIRSEGWLVYEKSSAESEIVKIINWERYDIITHKFGVWKRYHKNGSLAGIDSMNNDCQEISRQYDFDEEGCLTKIVFVQPADTITMISRKWQTRSITDLDWINFRYFKCGIILKEESFKNNYKKHGIWKWYKDGKLIKTKEYLDNKIIEKKKYET